MRQVLAIAAAGLLLLFSACAPEPPVTTTPAAEVSPVSTPAVTDSPQPDVEPQDTNAATPSQSATARPTPTAVGSVQPKNAYCIAYLRVIGAEVEFPDDDLDFDSPSFSEWAENTAQLYREAAELGPDEIKDEYQKVIQAIEDLKASADADDQDSIIAQMLQIFDVIDPAMDKIMEVSEPMCS